MTLYIVTFACYADDPVRLFVLSEEEHDRWCECEPREGYKHFRTIGRKETPLDLGQVIRSLDSAARAVMEGHG